MAQSKNEFYVVEFTQEEINGSYPDAIISSNWIFTDDGQLYCWWPNFTFETDGLREIACRCHAEPRPESDTKRTIRIKYQTDNYEAAIKKLRPSETVFLSAYSHPKTETPEEIQYEVSELNQPGTFQQRVKDGCTNYVEYNEPKSNQKQFEEELKYVIDLFQKNLHTGETSLELELPLKSLEELEEFNRNLSCNEQKYQKYLKDLLSIKGEDIREITRSVCSKLFDPKLAPTINWTGKNGKAQFSSFEKIVKLINDAVRGNPAFERKVRDEITSWLKSVCARERKQVKKDGA